MYVRELKHKNDRTYVQVIEKQSGKYKVLKSFGSAQTKQEIDILLDTAKRWIKSRSGMIEFDFEQEADVYKQLLENITSHKLIGIELVLGQIFDQIGFNQIQDELFKDLVLYRLVYPKSKLKTTEYLYRYQQKSYTEDDVYRYMDKLNNTQKELVQDISYRHTKTLFGNDVSVVFYDVTTIYFEIDTEDQLRKTGFSKEAKHQNPQIVLGLLVSKNGYPLAYDVFEGNKFEGHTMLPILDAFKTKYNLKQLIIVADSGLMSAKNIEDLQSKDYEFILGARIKNEEQHIQEQILSLKIKNGESKIIEKDDLKLIITYSDSRAKKDRHNRERRLIPI